MQNVSDGSVEGGGGEELPGSGAASWGAVVGSWERSGSVGGSKETILENLWAVVEAVSRFGSRDSCL